MWKNLKRNLRNTELDVFIRENGKEGKDMQTISPDEFKEGLVEYELGLRVDQASLTTDEENDFLEFWTGESKK